MFSVSNNNPPTVLNGTMRSSKESSYKSTDRKKEDIAVDFRIFNKIHDLTNLSGAFYNPAPYLMHNSKKDQWL